MGFRPGVYQLANKYKLTGWVNNSSDGVHIEINANELTARKFLAEIVSNPPTLARISTTNIEKAQNQIFTSFDIIESSSLQPSNLPLTPDFALCDDCRHEIMDRDNRRFSYAFTTCTNCGPRYSIITDMPYDRSLTTMKLFQQCPICSKEYNDPTNRRHYSQTNSCQQCGITLETEDREISISEITRELESGKVLAVKGIGGYLLLVDATNTEAIKSLRTRKNRPSKPFAVMYPSIQAIEKDFDVSEDVKTILSNEVSPIVLLEQKKNENGIIKEEIAPGLNTIGCMIPYAPLFQLILDRLNKPIVATSGNVSGSPIIYDDKLAIKELGEIADIIVRNDRDIVVPQDDSVIRFTQAFNHSIVIRRSRGLAPNLLNPGIDIPSKPILALGAQMKSSFALSNLSNLYVSQYLGDMENYLTQESYKSTLNHLLQIFKGSPEALVGDLHPNYFTTEFGHEMAKIEQIPFHQVQHHKAHLYAVLGENRFLDTTEPILGIIWDGTGYGDDEMIWGGETFVYQNGSTERAAHLPYFPFLLGDKMPREPRISALAVGSLMEEDDEYFKNKFTTAEWEVYLPMLAKPTLRTSSMGRVFDAIASVVLDINKISYEGEAAMMLEAAASAYIIDNPNKKILSYSFEQSTEPLLSILKSVIDDKKNGKSSGTIAARFHRSLVNLIRHEAQKHKLKKIAFSGGVFQNSVLVDMILTDLRNDFELFFHQQLSPNDECISFGQMAYYAIHEKDLT